MRAEGVSICLCFMNVICGKSSHFNFDIQQKLLMPLRLTEKTFLKHLCSISFFPPSHLLLQEHYKDAYTKKKKKTQHL